MADTLHNLYIGFSVALAPHVLLYAFVGCVVGTLVGVLPGIGPLAGISLAPSASFGLDATSSIVLLAGIYGPSEILLTAGQPTAPQVKKPKFKDLLPSKQEWRDSLWPIGRGTRGKIEIPEAK